MRAAAPPSISGVTPAPGFVQELTFVAVTFIEPVTGVQAGDFLVNGVPATGLTGNGYWYVFTFPQPAPGPVEITWGTLHSITDLSTPPVRFDGGAPGSTWAYQLLDPTPPRLSSASPIPGMTLRKLGQVEITFNRPVIGVVSSSLRLNGASAMHVSGVGAGPYLFDFNDASAGTATLSWSPQAGIVSDDPLALPFQGDSWSYRIDPTQPAPAILINEILAENQTGLADEERDPEDWIELYNDGSAAVDLGGWSFSVDREDAGQWVFPPVTIAPGGYLLIWASGKDRRDPSLAPLHTNFKLNPNGDTLRLYGPELPRGLVQELVYPAQSPNHSYGREGQGAQAAWKYFSAPTPTAANGSSTITGKADTVHFSVERGFFNAPFALSLASRTAGAEIRYTLDGSPPTPTNGVVYLEPININTTRVVRAAAFAPNLLPSAVRTHTYLMNLANNRRLLPVLSLVTGTNNLYGRTGIMEYNPRNTTKHGAAWERPVSAEWIRPGDNGGFQIDAGLRVAGGDYIRGRYNYRQTSPPEGKYSFRLYFRGDYGPGQLEYPVFPESTLQSYNTLHLRAGMNDPSNPLLKDEFVRELSLDVGITACHGTFVYLFLNGVYKGLYNPAERVDDDFLQAYHGGGDLWDVIGPANLVIRGDATAWNQLRTAVRKDLKVASNYVDVAGRMDLSNFIDYLLPLIWADNDDWPYNNTRAAREKKPGAPFRFYPWDAEFSFGSHAVSYDTIANTLSSLSPPWGTSDYQAMFNSLKKSPEFRLLFADRVHRAFFNDGPLTDARIRTRYNTVKAQVAPSISGFSDVVGTWIGARRRYVTNMFAKAGFLASSNAPVASQFGGRVPSGYPLTLQNLTGAIVYTTNGVDPRLPFFSTAAPGATTYSAPLTIRQPLHLMARSLDGTNWSALLDLEFTTSQVGSGLRFTEIMYHPPGGDAYEYVELQDAGGLPIDVGGCTIEGLKFRFPVPFPELAPGARLVVASDARPADFQRRYPGLAVAGWFSGTLDNGGERLALIDPAGKTLAAVEYRDQAPWPAEPDGAGPSLEVTDVFGNPNDPGNWRPGDDGGSPGAPNATPPPPLIQLNELNAGSDRDWIELYNPGPNTVSVADWSLTDNSNARQFVLPADARISGGGFIRIDCSGPAGGGFSAPFQLDRHGETIALFDANTNRVDAVQYGPTTDGYSLGRVGNRWRLCDPTPLAENLAAQLGDESGVTVNELQANPDTGADWIELYNAGLLPVALQGWAVGVGTALARIEAPAFLAPRGFALFWADERSGPDHLELRLPAAGSTLTLFSADGRERDRIVFGPQAEGISTGRLPDGAGTFRPLPFSPTPGSGNYVVELGATVRISEVLARSTHARDWIELENTSATNQPLSGFTVNVKASNEPGQSFSLPPSANLDPGERTIVYFGPVPTVSVVPAMSFPVPLPDWSGVITLLDGLGHIRDQVEYGPQVPDQSFGRTGQTWTLLSVPTPGEANSLPAALGNGDALRLNEWLAGGSGTNDFVELYNPSALPIDLANWVLTDDPSVSGSTNNRLRSLTFIPAQGFLGFHTDGHAERGLDHTGFRIDSLGETIRVLNPAGAIIDTVDLLTQAEGVSEGRLPDGTASVVRMSQPTPGLPNMLSELDADRDGIDDAWEREHGLDPTWAADADLDPDADGQLNRQEFEAGTDPHNAASMLRLSVVTLNNTGVKLAFAAQPGRTYVVEFAESVGSVWVVLAQIPAGTNTTEVLLNDPTPPGQRPTRFYRLTSKR